LTLLYVVCFTEITGEPEKQSRPASLKEELLQIGQECAALPILDNRSPEDIGGYNEVGVPA
jgi:antitoxin VapB